MGTFLIPFLCLVHSIEGVPANAGEVLRLGYNSDEGCAAAIRVPAIDQIYTTQVSPDPGVIATEDQIQSAFDRLASLLQQSGSNSDSLLRLHICAESQEVVDRTRDFLRKKFGESNAPTVTYVVGDLPLPGRKIAIDAIAVLGKGETDGKPHESGEDETRVLPAGPRVFISGQAEKGEFEEGVRGTMRSLFETLDFLGLSPSDIVQLKGFVQPIERAEEARSLMVECFEGSSAPPIVLVEWSSSLPIEIELIATAKGKEIRRGTWGEPLEFITPPGMTPSPVYSKLVYVEEPETILLSGLYGESATDASTQIHRIFESMKEFLSEAGSDLRHLVKATYYVSNDETSSQLNQIRPDYYDPARPPAASKAMVRGVGREGTGIAIDMIAVPNQSQP
ncbi:MAG: RidA family protein [Candidatus Omnitrophica bacterium]|nr:RidA family protein [Candidatus Omnitrophota bacterium]